MPFQRQIAIGIERTDRLTCSKLGRMKKKRKKKEEEKEIKIEVFIIFHLPLSARLSR